MSLSDNLRGIIKEIIIKIIPNESITELFVAIAMIIFWVIIAYLVTKLSKLLIFKTKGFKNKFHESETNEQLTVRKLINNLIRAVFIFWIAIMILKELGIDIVPLIAGAGVMAFAIGFGAQELIKDLISGLFLIGDKTIKIGDYVEINNYKGTITNIGLRRVKLENWKGDVITINNGDIKIVLNESLKNSFAVIEFTVEPNFDINLLYNKEFSEFLYNYGLSNPNVIKMPETALLTSINEGLKFTINIETAIRKHIGVERDFRVHLVNYFNKMDYKFKMTSLIKTIDGKQGE